MRPDRLSYVVKVGNRFFTRPRRLLRPVTPDTPSPVVSTTPPPSSLPILRRSPRLQSKVNTAVLRTPSLLHVPVSISSPSSRWPLCSSAMDKTSLTNTTKRSWSRSTSLSRPVQLLPPPLSKWQTTPTSPSTIASPMSPVMSAWTNQITDSHSLISTGHLSAPAYPPFSPLSWQAYSSRGVATSAGVDNANHVPVTRSFSTPSLLPPATSAPALIHSPANTPVLPEPHPQPHKMSTTPSSATLPPLPPLRVASRDAPHHMRDCPFRPSTEQSRPGIYPSPMKRSQLSPSSIVHRSSRPSTTNLRPRSKIAGSNTVLAKQESIPSLGSVSVKPSASIRPAHSISDYNQRDFSWSAVPGSVYSLHVKY